MPIKPHHQQLGVTLLELLMVLAVIAAILFLGINRYQTHKRITELAQVQQNIHYIFAAASIYYRTECKTNQTFNINMSLLEKAKLLPPLAHTQLVRKWPGSKFYYHVFAKKLAGKTQKTKQDIYQLKIQADLNVKPNTIDWYKTKLGAYSASASDTKLTWQSMPSYQQPTLDTSLWVMSAGLGYFKSFILGEDAKDASCAY